MKEKSLNKVINDPIKDKDDEVLDDYFKVQLEESMLVL